MGIAGKWLKILVKILVGLRKSEKLRKFEMAANNKAITNNLWQQQKNSLNLDGTTMDDVRSVETASRLRDDNTQLSSTSASSHSILLPAEETSQTEQNRKEEWAATVIQTAFRAFLARRALRALKGLVKLQALVRGNAVRKQAAITLRCMQALVRVQARIRARRIRMTLETQLAQQKLQQQPEHEAHVRLIEERWCDSVGSVEDIQAKMLKRQEAAAKRERAMAYALSHQWQAASRQQPVPPVTEAEKHDWGLNWLERWMAVRPWENRFLGINLKDGVMVRETESAGVADGSKIRPKLSDGKPGTRLRSSIPNHSARSGFTSNRCASFMATSALPSVKLKLKRVSEEGAGEAISKPSVVGIQSYRNTKERDSYMKKRLSLPRNVPAVDQELALQTEFQQIAANAQ